jgi:hypothetical protein
MEKPQADLIARAILEPNLHTQDEVRRKRAAEAIRLARKRRIAWFALTGSCVGAVVAYFSGMRFSHGVILGGLGGWLVGWLVTRRAP